jgi:hypothetical protein
MFVRFSSRNLPDEVNVSLIHEPMSVQSDDVHCIDECDETLVVHRARIHTHENEAK